jgi:hypothetical protein
MHIALIRKSSSHQLDRLTTKVTQQQVAAALLGPSKRAGLQGAPTGQQQLLLWLQSWQRMFLQQPQQVPEW